MHYFLYHSIIFCMQNWKISLFPWERAGVRVISSLNKNESALLLGGARGGCFRRKVF
jgi:hypothetical protein